MRRQLDYYWRLIGTGSSFSLFGIGGLLISIAVFPLIHLVTRPRVRAHRRCQYVVHLAFRGFVAVMRSLGVLTYEISGAERLRGLKGTLVVANHPSLIDVVFIISMLPETLCVVKRAAWRNPFLAGVMWSTGYLQNEDPLALIDACVEGLRAGNNLVIFPEATRTVPGRPMRLKRGAAAIIAKSRGPLISVIITCDPTTLTKAEKWYQIPPRRVHFQITVEPPLEPNLLPLEEANLGLQNRRINRILAKIFKGGIEKHVRSRTGNKDTIDRNVGSGRYGA